MNSIKKLIVEKTFLETVNSVSDLTPPWLDNRISATDYTIANGGFINYANKTITGHPTTMAFLASGSPEDFSSCVFSTGNPHGYIKVTDTDISIAPALMLKLPQYNGNLEKIFDTKFKLCCYETKYGIYNTIKFANVACPQTKADKATEEELKRELSNGTLEKSKYIFSGRLENGIFKQFKTYRLANKLYALVDTKIGDFNTVYSDGSKAVDGDKIFVQVQPIEFIIRNKYRTLPKYINPRGNSKDTILKLRAESGVVSGIPFNTHGYASYKHKDTTARKYVEQNFIKECFLDEDLELD